MPTVLVEHLSRTYRSGSTELIALDDLSLSLDAGEIFGFIGPNGAGKTTTIKILSTLLQPTSGRAVVCGHDVSLEPSMVRRLIGYMPDFFGVYDDIKVWEYLDFFAAAYKIPKHTRQSVISGVLDLTDLTIKKEAYVESLSRGMKQRLCLAKTLIHDPPVLLLDEPASGLDPRARIEIRELLKELKSMGKTILVSSHILPEMEDFCTRIGIIERGKLLVQGKVDEIIATKQGGTKFVLRVVDDIEKAAAILASIPFVTVEDPGSHDQTREPNTIAIIYSGEMGSEHKVLTCLISAGVKVLSFYAPPSDLEDIFMAVTTGAVN